MKRILILLALLCLEKTLHAQFIYKIKADSVMITNSCDTAELIIENHTQTVPGFLFNKGRGRTEFRRAMIKINDSIYAIGGDTLRLSVAWLQGGNTFGTTGYFGTRDNNHIDFYTNATKRGRWTNTGNFLVGGDTDYGYKMAVDGAVYGKFFTNSTTLLDAGDGALRLRWGGTGGSYIDFYNSEVNKDRRGYISSGADYRPLEIYDKIGLTLEHIPFVSIGTEWPSADSLKFSITTAVNSIQDPMRVANITNAVLRTTTSYLRVKRSGNTILGDGNDNANRLQVNGTSWFGNTAYFSHPTFATGGMGAGIGWVGNNMFQIYGGPSHESLTFGPANAITSSAMFMAPNFYATSTGGGNYYVPSSGGEYTTTNSSGNLDAVVHKFTMVQPIDGALGNPTLVEISKPVNRGIVDGRETGLRIRFSVTGTANNLRALETVNGDVRLHTTSGRTSIGLDGSSTITSRLDVSGEDGYNQLRLRKKYTPTSSSDTNGALGDVSWDDSYIYIKTSSGWKRTQLETF